MQVIQQILWFCQNKISHMSKQVPTRLIGLPVAISVDDLGAAVCWQVSFCRGCSLGSGGVAWWLRALAAHTWGPGFRSHSSPVTPWEEGVEDCWGRSLGLAVFQPSWEQYEPQVQKETMPQKHTTTTKKNPTWYSYGHLMCAKSTPTCAHTHIDR